MAFVNIFTHLIRSVTRLIGFAKQASRNQTFKRLKILRRRIFIAGCTKNPDMATTALNDCHKKLHDLLITQDAPIDCNERQILEYACGYGNRAILNILLKRGFNPLKEFSEGLTPIVKAVIVGNLAVLKKLKKLGAQLPLDPLKQVQQLFLEVNRILPFINECSKGYRFINFCSNLFEPVESKSIHACMDRKSSILSCAVLCFLDAYATGRNPYEIYDECEDFIKKSHKIKAHRRLHTAITESSCTV